MSKKKNTEAEAKNVENTEEVEQETVNPWDAMWGLGRKDKENEIKVKSEDIESNDTSEEEESGENDEVDRDSWFFSW